MTTQDEQSILKKILASPFAQKMVLDLGIKNDTEEMRVYVMSLMGKNILTRVVLTLLNMMPESEHLAFADHMKSGNEKNFRAFLLRYVPELDTVIEKVAREELEFIQSHAAEILRNSH